MIRSTYAVRRHVFVRYRLDLLWCLFLPYKPILSFEIPLLSLKLKTKASEGITWIWTWKKKPCYFSVPLNKEWPIFFFCFRILFIFYCLESIRFSQFLAPFVLRTHMGRKQAYRQWVLSFTKDKSLVYVSDSIADRIKFTMFKIILLVLFRRN